MPPITTNWVNSAVVNTTSQSSSKEWQAALAKVNASLLEQHNKATSSDESSFSLIRPKGDPYSLYQQQPALNDSAKALAERLDGPINRANAGEFFYHESMRDLLHAGVLIDPEFLDMSASMSDDELANFMTTIKAMMLPASERYTSQNESNRSYKDKVAAFVGVLKIADTSDRAAILKQSSNYATLVDSDAVTSFRNNVFGQSLGKIRFAPYQSDSSSNQLHNYVSAIVATDDPAALTKQLGEMDADAQRGLLSIYGLDTALGERLAKVAGPDGKGLPSSLLSSLGDMADAVKTLKFLDTSKIGIAWTDDEALQVDNEESSRREFAVDAVGKMISMLEKYNFSDEQLETMGSDMSALSNPDKRAYIEITTIGLDNMLQRKADEHSNSKSLDEAIAVVSELRSNKNVLSLVNGSRYHDVTLIERPNIEEGMTLVTLEGAAVFGDAETAMKESRLLLDAMPGQEHDLYSAKSFDLYQQDVSNLVGTLVAFTTMRDDSTARNKASLDDFTDMLADMHSGVRDETLRRINDELETNNLQEKSTKNTAFAFFASLVQEVEFETRRDFARG